MAVTRLNAPFYVKENKAFIHEIKPIVDEMMQQQSIGPEGYHLSTVDNFVNNRHQTENLYQDDLIDPKSAQIPNGTNIVNLNKLGPVEKCLVGYLLSSTYNTIVMPGALGIGKTATVKHVLDYISVNINHTNNDVEACNACKIKNFISIRINFIDGYLPSNYSAIMHTFTEDLYNKLKRKITNIYNKYPATDNIVDKVINTNIKDESDDQWESKFDDFVSSNVKNNTQWNNYTLIQKNECLFNWIDQKTDYESKIALLGYLIRFVKESNYIRQGCFIILFDNIDQLTQEEVQNDILTFILRFSEVAKVKILIPMRQTAFGWIAANAAYSFGHFVFAGVLPIKIITNRMKYYIEQGDTNANYKQLKKAPNSDYIDKYEVRLRHIYDLLRADANNRLREVIDAISGNSIRRGLYITCRLFLNYVIKYDEPSPYENDLIRALFVSNNEEGTINPKDSLVTNLYVSQEDNLNSLLKIRILQLLYNAKKNKKRATIQILLDQLKRLYNWDNRIILSDINILMNARKKLIYVDGKNHYESTNDLFSSPNDRVNITYTGQRYLEVLLNELVYNQECFAAALWPKAVPNEVDYSSLIERFSFMRKCLNELLESDYRQTRKYISNTPINKRFINGIIVNEIISNTALSMLNIVKSKKMSYLYQEELKDWLSLLNKASVCEDKIFKNKNNSKSNKHAVKTIELYLKS